MPSTDYPKMPPHIIEHLKKEEEKKRRRSPAQVPLYDYNPEYPPEERRKDDDKPKDDNGGWWKI